MEARGRPLGRGAGLFGLAIALSLVSAARAQAGFEYVSEWGAPKLGELIRPFDVERDNAGNTYVVDSVAHSVTKYDAAYNPVLRWGSLGTAPGEFGFPTAIGINEVSGEVYVSDFNEAPLQARIQRFDSSGNYLGQFGSIGEAEGQFGLISGIAVHPLNGDVYVTGSDRVQRFSANGTFELMWGKDVQPGGGTGPETCVAGCKAGVFGDAEGELNDPEGIAATAVDVFVAERDNQRVSRFDADGDFELMAGGDVTPGGGMAGETCAAGCQAGAFGTGPREFSFPVGLDMNGALGRVFIVDSSNDRVQRLSAGLAYQTEFGSPGTGEGEFDHPTGLTENDGHVLVTEPEPDPGAELRRRQRRL